jgi:lipopolysaccharide export system protein LptC
MTDRLTAWFPLLLLMVLAGLTFWLDRAVQPAPANRDGSKRHDPDYIIENFSALRLDANGKPRHQLAARRMLHFPDDDSTQLDEPRFVRFEPGKASLSVTSRSALVSSNGENVYFDQAVKVVRGAYSTRSELVVTTEYLHVIPEADIAKTDRAVRIVDANTKIEAVGLELNNKAQTVKLLANVKGTYVKRK